ncbi:hypothetical protein NQ314_013067 [Rhamnusium bicolor]|uniref:Protein kinase domain-containing protein n=1 Tax=Rhamnusium bicolor TaxID=1586634 RepID=A0AAV8X926_9CUCU|nr:hypothetical protein NQ314_013067 [Rhamnusium bicolor]
MQRSPLFDRSSSPWAIKKLIQRQKSNIELDKRLKAEAEVLRKLKHPNIVGFRAFAKDPDGRNVLAMEECTSCLGDMIEERNQPYAAKTIMKVSNDMAKALEYLHNEALLLHCDVKSYNVLIKGDFCICKLCDFGVCLPITEAGEVDWRKAGEEAEYIGTGAWCAPEILKFPQEISTKADVYAFGLVIWEMIALAPPIDEDFVNSLSESQIDTDLSSESLNLSNIEKPLRKRPSLPDIDLDVGYNIILEIFFCCTHDDKNKRPAAKDLVIILEKLRNDNCS